MRRHPLPILPTNTIVTRSLTIFKGLGISNSLNKTKSFRIVQGQLQITNQAMVRLELRTKYTRSILIDVNIKKLMNFISKALFLYLIMFLVQHQHDLIINYFPLKLSCMCDGNIVGNYSILYSSP